MALTAIPATSAPARPRTLLVDADRAFAELLAGALPRVGMTWVGTAHSAKDGIALSRRLQPDVVTLDLDLPAQDGLSAARRIRAVAPQSVIAVVTGYRDFAWVVRSAEAGASAYISKYGTLAELLDVLSRARPGQMIVAPSAFDCGPAPPPAYHTTQAPRPALTRRERDVLDRLHRGMQAKAIADDLGITHVTCRSSMKSLYVKLGARSQLEAVVRAQELGLVPRQVAG